MIGMSGTGYFSERNLYGVLGSLFGVVGPLISVYILSLGENEDIIINITEATVWALWLSFQGIGFYLIYQRDRDALFLFTFILGIVAALFEILLVLWMVDIQSEVSQLAVISLFGIGSFSIYLILCASIMFKTSDNDYAKLAGFLLLVSAVFHMTYLAFAAGILVIANVILRFIFSGYGTPKQQ
ncbi:MAG: hypothetical protein P1Q69_08845 [Candidatus Thorarchaeota archaeon]|nr:hypothetical protein [Candidatus Thorarchaeota archaeon]